MSDKPVFRLLDIEVEEVSLVDRAANKHRFLIVKRSDMTGAAQKPEGETDENPLESDADDADETAQDQEAGDGDAEPEIEETPEGGQGGGGSTPPPVVAAAVDALAKLTDVVEKLESAGAEGPELTQATGELRAIAEQLTKAAAPKKPRRKPAAPPPDEDEDEPQTKSVLAEVRAALGQMQALLTRAGRPAARKPAAKSQAPSEGKSEAAAKLDAVLERLEAIGQGFKDHTQRLSRLEKQSGLPNSAPVGERPERASEDEEAFWSFDLNRPTDRASVDRSISFFDEPA